MDGKPDAPEHMLPVYGRSPVFRLLLPFPDLSGFSFSPWVCGRVSSFGFSVILPPCGSNALIRAAFRSMQEGLGASRGLLVCCGVHPPVSAKTARGAG